MSDLGSTVPRKMLLYCAPANDEHRMGTDGRDLTDLIHAGIGEEEGGVVEGDGGGRGDIGVPLAREKVEKGLPDAVGGPVTVVGHSGEVSEGRGEEHSTRKHDSS